MNEKYVVDAYAWVEYLIGGEAGRKVKNALEEETNEFYTCAVTVAEVIGKTAREGRDTEVTYDILTSNSQIIDVDEVLSKEVGILDAETRRTVRDFSLADAYVLTSARRIGSKVLTGDPHFKRINEAVLVR